MKEKIYNIFLETQGEYIRQIGVVEHLVSGTDQEKIDFLQKNAKLDITSMSTFPIPDRFQFIDDDNFRHKRVLRISKYRELNYIGKSYELFKEIFNYYDSPMEPLMCISFVVDGQLKIDGEMSISINDTDCKEIHFNETQGYLEKYFNGEEFFILLNS